jgi:hypothetical protein
MRALKIRVLIIALTALALACAGCETLTQEPVSTIELPSLGLVLTPVPGWSIDETVSLKDPAKGGVLIRMSSTAGLSGAPKFQVYLDPLRVKPPGLDTLAQEQWGRMKSVESQTGVAIEKMEKTKVTLLNKEAVLLDQTYTLGSGASQIAVSERVWLTQHDERGLAFVVSGRTELLKPWNDQIETMISSLSLQTSPAQ